MASKRTQHATRPPHMVRKGTQSNERDELAQPRNLSRAKLKHPTNSIGHIIFFVMLVYQGDGFMVPCQLCQTVCMSLIELHEKREILETNSHQKSLSHFLFSFDTVQELIH